MGPVLICITHIILPAANQAKKRQMELESLESVEGKKKEFVEGMWYVSQNTDMCHGSFAANYQHKKDIGQIFCIVYQNFIMKF